MLNVGAAPIHLYLPPTDMRNSFNSLSALVYAHLGRPEDGSYYVFVNRRKTHVKILYWDRDGLALWYKRLARGQFFRLCKAQHNRKKWLFAGCKEGGDATGILLSLVQTCRAMNVEPFAYIEDVLRRISDHRADKLDELLPDKWQPAKR